MLSKFHGKALLLEARSFLLFFFFFFLSLSVSAFDRLIATRIEGKGIIVLDYFMGTRIRIRLNELRSKNQGPLLFPRDGLRQWISRQIIDARSWFQEPLNYSKPRYIQHVSRWNSSLYDCRVQSPSTHQKLYPLIHCRPFNDIMIFFSSIPF